MTNVLHINCGTLHAPPNPKAACHCLLLSDPAGLAPILTQLDLAGLIVLGPAGASPRLGAHPGAPFEQRLKTALDPQSKFPTIPVLSAQPA